MKQLTILFLCGLVTWNADAQRITAGSVKTIQQKEDSLKVLSVNLIQGINAADRLKADSSLTRILVRALKEPNSFYYPFDALETVSRLYAPDSSFRIFTWQMVVNDNVVRQHGAIQMRTYDGSLKLFPLIDKSDIIGSLKDTVGNYLGWVGAIYYKIIQKKNGPQNIYTLLGYDENNIRSNRKIIEVLRFVNEEPVFGGRYFSYENDAAFKSSESRYILEYKKSAGPKLNYDPELDMILVEHLISESNEPLKKWTLIGDGDYEGFRWSNGKWVHVEKVYNNITPLGQEPIPQPLRDAQGTMNEQKLKGNEPDPSEKPKPATKPSRKVD